MNRNSTRHGAMLAHYGVVADPARVQDPNRKGAVENAIGHTQDTALKGRRFESLEGKTATCSTGKRSGRRSASTAEPSGKSKRRSEERTPAPQAAAAGGLSLFRGKASARRATTPPSRSTAPGTRRGRHASAAKRLIRVDERELEIRAIGTPWSSIRRSFARQPARARFNSPDAERVFDPDRQTHQDPGPRRA